MLPHVVKQRVSAPHVMCVRSAHQNETGDPRDISKHQQQAETSIRRMICQRGLVVKPMENRTSYEWENIGKNTRDMQEELVNQGKEMRQEDTRKMVLHNGKRQFLEGTRSKYAAYDDGTAKRHEVKAQIWSTFTAPAK